VNGESPDGAVAFGGWPACVDHLRPATWPAWVWDEITDALAWEDGPEWQENACPLCALPHGPLTTCVAFRAAVEATWPYKRPPAMN
jgi:hypothetical protein